MLLKTGSRWIVLALLLLSPLLLAGKSRRIVKQIDDVRVTIVLTEVSYVRLWMENDYVRNHPELCPICEEMAASSDSLLWVPLGFAWEREGGLVVDPVVELLQKGQVYRSQRTLAYRFTDPPLVGFPTPIRIPPGWRLGPEYADWKGVTVYAAFPRAIHPPEPGWPLTLHLEDVEDANVRIN